MAAPDPGELAELAVRAAEAAARLLVDGLQVARAEVATKSSATDMVTEMDRASEELLRSALLTARPDDGFLGEETGGTPGTSGVRWVVDPVDGTTNYLYGHPGFGISVAAEVDGVAVAGAVVDPLHGDTFAAAKGAGARRNGATITCSTVADPAVALVATGFSYDPDRRARQAGVLTEVLPRVRDIRRMGAAAVDLCSTACGRVDAYYEKGLGRWDLAAGSLIAAEAGARVADEDELGYVLAAPPALFDPLREILSAAGAAQA